MIIEMGSVSDGKSETLIFDKAINFACLHDEGKSPIRRYRLMRSRNGCAMFLKPSLIIESEMPSGPLLLEQHTARTEFSRSMVSG